MAAATALHGQLRPQVGFGHRTTIHHGEVNAARGASCGGGVPTAECRRRSGTAATVANGLARAAGALALPAAARQKDGAPTLRSAHADLKASDTIAISSTPAPTNARKQGSVPQDVMQLFSPVAPRGRGRGQEQASGLRCRVSGESQLAKTWFYAELQGLRNWQSKVLRFQAGMFGDAGKHPGPDFF